MDHSVLPWGIYYSYLLQGYTKCLFADYKWWWAKPPHIYEYRYTMLGEEAELFTLYGVRR